VFWCYSLLVKLHKIGEVLHFRLLGKKDFPVKKKNERFPAVNLRCRQNLKYENVTWTFGRLGQFITPQSVPQVQHDYLSPLNQSSHWFLVLLPSSRRQLLQRGRQRFSYLMRKIKNKENRDFGCTPVLKQLPGH